METFLPLSDVIAFTHVKSLNVYTLKQVSNYCCACWCVSFSLPAVFVFFSFLENSFVKIKTILGAGGRRDKRRKRKDFNGKCCKDAEPRKRNKILLWSFSQTKTTLMGLLAFPFPSNAKGVFGIKRGSQGLPASMPIACYEILHVQCKKRLQMFTARNELSRVIANNAPLSRKEFFVQHCSR